MNKAGVDETKGGTATAQTPRHTRDRPGHHPEDTVGVPAVLSDDRTVRRSNRSPSEQVVPRLSGRLSPSIVETLNATPPSAHRPRDGSLTSECQSGDHTTARSIRRQPLPGSHRNCQTAPHSVRHLPMPHVYARAGTCFKPGRFSGKSRVESWNGQHFQAFCPVLDSWFSPHCSCALFKKVIVAVLSQALTLAGVSELKSTRKLCYPSESGHRRGVSLC